MFQKLYELSAIFIAKLLYYEISQFARTFHRQVSTLNICHFFSILTEQISLTFKMYTPDSGKLKSRVGIPETFCPDIPTLFYVNIFICLKSLRYLSWCITMQDSLLL